MTHSRDGNASVGHGHERWPISISDTPRYSVGCLPWM